METSDWEVILRFSSLSLTVLVPMLMFLVKRTSANAQALGDLRTHVAENYATKTDVNLLADRIERHMDKQFDNLKNTIKDNNQ